MNDETAKIQRNRGVSTSICRAINRAAYRGGNTTVKTSLNVLFELRIQTYLVTYCVSHG